MLKNYFHTAIRSFKKNKVYTLISVLSLSFGITCCLTQFAILRHEFTFDSFHKQKDQIYRVVEHEITEKGIIGLSDRLNAAEDNLLLAVLLI